MTSKLSISVLTGSLGSGKSTVAKLFEKEGALIIDSDILARQVVGINSVGLSRVINHFGPSYLLPNGELNRKLLGQLVFNDKSKLEELENILHPLIRVLHQEQISEIAANAKNPTAILCVIPLFFESRFTYPEIENIIVVKADRDACMKRVIKRDGCSADLANKKYDSQLSIELKVSKADFVIDNNRDPKALESQVKEIYLKILP